MDIPPHSARRCRDDERRAASEQGRHLRKIGASRPIRANNLIVAGIDHEEVRLKAGHLPGDLVEDVGVYRHNPGVDDLEVPARKTVPQLRPQLRGKCKTWHGHALRSGFPEHDDP